MSISHEQKVSDRVCVRSDAFATVRTDLRKIQMFHSDRGSEFKNEPLDKIISTFQIKRFLSMKGCPYDNAVAEATFKIFKTEFVYGRNFYSLAQLRHELISCVNWFNNFYERCFMFVEGPTEENALPVFYSKLHGSSLIEDGIRIIDIEGWRVWQNYVKLLGINKRHLMLFLFR